MMDLLFGFNGRIRRLHYWLAGIGTGVVLGFLYAIVMMIFGGALMAARSAGGAGGAGGLGLLAMLLSVVIGVAAIWIGLALQIKRWHDRDKSGVWVLINFIPFIGALWTLIECGFMDGTPGPNKYGPSPKGVGGPEPAAAPAA